MKLYKNFECLVSVECNHWYYGSKFSEFALILDEDDYENRYEADFYQKVVNTVLNTVDKRRMFEDYSIKMRYFFGKEVETIELSEQFIVNWKNDNIRYYK